jgi:hypothetical protein
MTGPEHYAESERLIQQARDSTGTDWRALYLTQAQVHATLALAAATALPGDSDCLNDTYEWKGVAGQRAKEAVR